MKVAMLNLTTGGISGGNKKYLCNIIPRISASPAISKMLFISPVRLEIEGRTDCGSIEFKRCKPLGLARYKIDSELRVYLGKFLPDVIFATTEHPFYFNKIPVVHSVQNMEPLIFNNDSNPISERIKNFLRARSARRAIETAARVIAVSEFVKDFLVCNWNIPENKIGVVYWGADISEKINVARPTKIPSGWDKKFIFTAGSIRPARGLEDILWAMSYLNANATRPTKLLIAGDTNPNMVVYKNKLMNWIEKKGFSDQVCWAGNLMAEEMAWCYKNCKAFIMSSRVEAFGMIAVEAMSHGCVCISADNPCLPEIFKDAAVYYPPQNSRVLARIIEDVENWDSMKKEKAVERSKKRAADFLWDLCAERTVAELIRAHEER